MAAQPPGLLVIGASEILTMAGGPRGGTAQAETASIRLEPAAASEVSVAPAVAVFEGRIVGVGTRREVEGALREHGVEPAGIGIVDAKGGVLTPGLIDPHSHLLFAGTRHAELVMRQRGFSYLDILAAGGGILQTVRHTRTASDDQLLEHGRRWLSEMLSHGVTTVEAKSGYGLDTASELRLLELAGRLGAVGPIEVVPTFLGAHAVAQEYRDRPDAVAAYLAHVIEDQLPAVADQGIAQSCDVFCERGVFEPVHARRLLEAARKRDLAVRLHADELHESGGAELAAEIGALSADHLAAVGDHGLDALGRTADVGRPVVATLLPATTFYLLSERYAPARRLIERGVPVALGTDFNPGTSPTPNIQLALSLATLRLGMSAAEALVGATINAAAALGLQESHGSLEPGKHADMVVWDVESYEQIPYWLGARLARTVIKRGRVVLDT
ncbi:MAG TPA: imidazolonepropionase [Candidatus Limnocylindrales bacterium]|nr:imidazolonepropionase [Candidatus Limnocylindrales bacterium]